MLRAGKHDRALYVLTGHVNEFSPYWYELALLHFMNEAYMNAAMEIQAEAYMKNTYGKYIWEMQ